MLMKDGFSHQHKAKGMDDEPKQYYLLTATEAELLACYRRMDDQAQAATAYIMAAQSMGREHVAPVKLSLVSKD